MENGCGVLETLSRFEISVSKTRDYVLLKQEKCKPICDTVDSIAKPNVREAPRKYIVAYSKHVYNQPNFSK